MSDYSKSGDFGDQLSILSDVPIAGQLYRNRHTGDIAAVVSVEHRRRPWITYRSWGDERTTDLQVFTDNWQRCRLDGTLL